MTMLATSDARSGISEPTARGGSTSSREGVRAELFPVALPLPCDGFSFLRARFVEAVLTCFTDLPEPREEIFVECHAPLPHLLAFERPDDDVLDAVLRDERRGFRRACVDALQVGLALRVVNAVRPDVAGVAQECAPPRQVNGVIISRRVQNQRARRRSALNCFGESNLGGVVCLPLDCARRRAPNVKPTRRRLRQKQPQRERPPPGLHPPQTREHERDQRGRSDPPVEQNLYVVPNPRREP